MKGKIKLIKTNLMINDIRNTFTFEKLKQLIEAEYYDDWHDEYMWKEPMEQDLYRNYKILNIKLKFLRIAKDRGRDYEFYIIKFYGKKHNKETMKKIANHFNTYGLK